VAGAGLLLLSDVGPGDSYVTGVFPGIVVLGLGLATTVAPLTAVVLAAVDDHHHGVASGVNNAVARVASLIGVAAIPVVAGVDLAAAVGTGLPGYRTALLIAAGLCVVGGVVAAATIRRAADVRPSVQASILDPCRDPCQAEPEAA
jgi:MFS family permease